MRDLHRVDGHVAHGRRPSRRSTSARPSPPPCGGLTSARCDSHDGRAVSPDVLEYRIARLATRHDRRATRRTSPPAHSSSAGHPPGSPRRPRCPAAPVVVRDRRRRRRAALLHRRAHREQAPRTRTRARPARSPGPSPRPHRASPMTDQTAPRATHRLDARQLAADRARDSVASSASRWSGSRFFFNVTLMMFKTGSMSPTIPAGSVALVREIPASEIQVGDVVTVARPDALPVTHRVTSVADGPTSRRAHHHDARRRERRGRPCAVHRLERAHRHGLAARARVRHRVVLEPARARRRSSIAVAVLVTWSFWPREPRQVAPAAEVVDVASSVRSIGRLMTSTCAAVARRRGCACTRRRRGGLTAERDPGELVGLGVELKAIRRHPRAASGVGVMHHRRLACAPQGRKSELVGAGRRTAPRSEVRVAE